MKNKNIKLGLLAMFLSNFLVLAYAANIAYVAKTGPGASTGAGKQWPTKRFIVDGDCITDNLTGLMWPKNSQILGRGYWSGSNEKGSMQYKVTQMNTESTATGYHLCGHSDWRIANITELLSLINYTAIQNGSTPYEWLNSQGFTNFTNSMYYSSSITNKPYFGSCTGAYNIQFAKGNVFQIGCANNPVNTLPFLPVRGGQ